MLVSTHMPVFVVFLRQILQMKYRSSDAKPTKTKTAPRFSVLTLDFECLIFSANSYFNLSGRELVPALIKSCLHLDKKIIRNSV